MLRMMFFSNNAHLDIGLHFLMHIVQHSRRHAGSMGLVSVNVVAILLNHHTQVKMSWMYCWTLVKGQLEVCTGQFFGPGMARTHFSFISPINPLKNKLSSADLAHWKNHLSFAGLAHWKNDLSSAGPAHWKNHLSSVSPPQASGPARARAYLYHSLLWDPVHEKLKL